MEFFLGLRQASQQQQQQGSDQQRGPEKGGVGKALHVSFSDPGD